MVEVEFEVEARAEYRAAIAHYRDRSPRAAGRFVDEVQRLIAAISVSPHMFTKLDDVTRFAKLHKFPYSLIYTVGSERVSIVAVAHNSRSPDYWRDRA